MWVTSFVNGPKDIRNHKCTKCPKAFHTLSRLNGHIQCVHEGRRDHRCAECGKAFSTPGYLKTHIECVHEGRRDINVIIAKRHFLLLYF